MRVGIVAQQAGVNTRPFGTTSGVGFSRAPSAARLAIGNTMRKRCRWSASFETHSVSGNCSDMESSSWEWIHAAISGCSYNRHTRYKRWYAAACCRWFGWLVGAGRSTWCKRSAHRAASVHYRHPSHAGRSDTGAGRQGWSTTRAPCAIVSTGL